MVRWYISRWWLDAYQLSPTTRFIRPPPQSNRNLAIFFAVTRIIKNWWNVSILNWMWWCRFFFSNFLVPKLNVSLWRITNKYRNPQRFFTIHTVQITNIPEMNYIELYCNWVKIFNIEIFYINEFIHKLL